MNDHQHNPHEDGSSNLFEREDFVPFGETNVITLQPVHTSSSYKYPEKIPIPLNYQEYYPHSYSQQGFPPPNYPGYVYQNYHPPSYPSYQENHSTFYSNELSKKSDVKTHAKPEATINNISSTITSQSSNSSDAENVIVVDVPHEPLLNYSQSSEIITPEVVSEQRENNYIYQVLMSSGEGIFLIKAYDFEVAQKSDGIVESESSVFHVGSVARIVIFHEYKRTGSLDISSDRLETLAKLSAELFPSINQKRFYCKYQKGEHVANGAFQAFYNTLRCKATRINEIKKAPRPLKRKLSNDVKENSENFKVLQEPVKVIDDSYISKWSSSLNRTEKITFYSNNDLKSILTALPNLVLPLGYNSIKSDFESFFNETDEEFQKNWSAVAPNIVKLAIKKKYTDSDVKSYLQVNDSLIKNGDVDLLALILLPFLFKKILKLSKKSKFGKPWYPEKAETLSCFIYHIKERDNFSEAFKSARTEVSELHNSHLIQEKPYVIIYGPALNKITASYVVVEDHVYQVATALSAVNLCLQVVKTFHDRFSLISNHIWHFIEHVTYKFEANVTYTGTMELVDKLKELS